MNNRLERGAEAQEHWRWYFARVSPASIRKGRPHRVPALDVLVFGLPSLQKYLRENLPHLGASWQPLCKQWPPGCIAMGPRGANVFRK